MCAYRAWILTASSVIFGIAAAAGPLSADDIRLERQAVPRDICLEKARAYSCLQTTGSGLSKWVLLSGVSTVQNKLASVDVSTVIPPREAPLETLGAQPETLGSGAASRQFSAHVPDNGRKNILDVRGIEHPERYVSPRDLQSGVNVLVPVKTILAPACLSAPDLEGYIRLRVDLGLKTGDYWAYLHATKFTDEQLALLRYYDYLDSNAPKRPVAVYRCTELVMRGKH